MICAVCYGVLRGHQGSQWRGTFDLHFDHQRNRTELKKSAAISCCICRSISSELTLIERKDRNPFLRTWNGVCASLAQLIWGEPFRLSERSSLIGAYLSEVPELELLNQPKIYRLDFKLKDSERLGTFVLEQVGKFSIPYHSQNIYIDSKMKALNREVHFIPHFPVPPHQMRSLK
jgi:hypothetical protein